MVTSTAKMRDLGGMPPCLSCVRPPENAKISLPLHALVARDLQAQAQAANSRQIYPRQASNLYTTTMSKFWAAAGSDDSSSSSDSSDDSSSSSDSSAVGGGGGRGDANRWVMDSDSGKCMSS